jgi:hypothetical protein
MSRVRRSQAATVIGVTVAAAMTLLLVGCSASADSSTPGTAAPSEAVDEGTSLADVDTTSLVVARAPFCDAVDPAAVARALDIGRDEEPAEGSAYRSGQRIKLSDGTRGGAADVVHEFGCRWTAGDGVAEAWVFVPPVTRERAADLVRTGCRGVQDPAFGEPSTICRTQADGVATYTFRGLFGDAWLTCRLVVGADQDETLDRAGRWCAAVATGASAG